MDIDISQVKMCNKDFWYLEPGNKLGIENIIMLNATYIALGNNAHKKLQEMQAYIKRSDYWEDYNTDLKIFKLPHPSPRNFQNNNKQFIKKKLKECKNWLKK